MTQSAEKREKIIKEFKRHDKDTGSPEVQIALLTDRIKQLTEHIKENNKDFQSRRGLEILVSKRRRLLNYLRRTDYERFKELTDKLEIRA